MTTWRDLPVDMRRQPLDADTVDRMFAGAVHPDDAPPGFAEAAGVLRALSAPAVPAELERQADAVDRMRAEVRRNSHGPVRAARRTRMRRGLLKAKVGSMVVVGTLAATTGMAMAGALPGAAQGVAATVLSRVGISVPNPHAQDHPANTGGTVSDLARTTDATGVDKGALISSLASAGKSGAGQDAAAQPSDTKGSTISDLARTTDATGVDKGAEVSAAASDGRSQAGQHQPSTGSNDGAPVTTPNSGGTGTAGQASGGVSDTGTTTADDSSGGHSAAGSGNAGSHGGP
jgi:hypothetical protein